MFDRIGRLSSRFRWWVIAAWGVLMLAALPILPSIEAPLKVGGFSSEGAEGARTTALLERELDYSPSSLVLVYASDSLDASTGEFQDQVAASIDKMRRLPFVEDVILPSLDESLIAPSGDVAYAIIGLSLPPEEAQRYVAEAEDAILPQPDLDIIVAGAPAFYADIETASQRDLRRAEFIALPFALLALLLVFGTVVAAIVPMIVGCVGVGVILLSIYWAAHVTDVSIFALNLATMLGLGLAVDYSLFVTSRFREELGRKGEMLVRQSSLPRAGRAGLSSFQG